MQDEFSLTLPMLRCKTALKISRVAMENKIQDKMLCPAKSHSHHYSFPELQVSKCKAGEPDVAASSLSCSQTHPIALRCAVTRSDATTK